MHETLLQELLKKNGRLLIAIDGRCGCGKSRLAALLAETLPASVFHMDDFYLPFALRSGNWRSVPAGNMDLVRFRSEILERVAKGEAVSYRAYSCPQKRYLPEVDIPFRPVSIIEGSYSHHPVLADLYDVKLFITADRETQAERLRVREGAQFSAFEEIWIPMEELYFETFAVEEKADCVIITDRAIPVWNWKRYPERPLPKKEKERLQ